MPSGDNSFYIDQLLPNQEYGKFIGQELVEITRRAFPLAHKREETILAGLSMGGFGLYLYGLIPGEREKGDPLTQKELPYTIAMIVLDIAAPILLMLGERPAMQFYLGLAVMIVATVLLIRDTISLQHTHEHSHGDLIHIHTHTHGADESVHDHRLLNIV